MVSRHGAYLMIVDDAGRRHFVRITAVQIASDTDQFHDSCTIMVAGRPITVPEPLEDVLEAMTGDGEKR